jgi:hypothetical protein
MRSADFVYRACLTVIYPIGLASVKAQSTTWFGIWNKHRTKKLEFREKLRTIGESCLSELHMNPEVPAGRVCGKTILR